MEVIYNITNDITCPGVIINLVITIIVLVIGTIFGVNTINNSQDSGMKLKIIVVMVGLYLFWLLWGTFWHRLSSRLCSRNLYSDSAFVSLSPIIFVVIISFSILFVLGMLELIKVLLGKKWEEIILLTEFKDKIDGTKLIIKDSTLGEDLMNIGRNIEIQADNLKDTISETRKIYKETKDPGTNKLLKDYITKEKRLRKESVEKLNKGRIYNDKYLGKNYIIKNLKDNPYGLVLIGDDRNSHMRAEVIIEHRLKNGWSGILKILELDKNRPDIKYLDKSKYDDLFKKEYNIKSEVYGKIKFITRNYENIVIIENNKENETYLPEGKSIWLKLLHGLLVLFILIFVVGIGFGLISGETYNISNMYILLEKKIKSNFEKVE